MPSPPATDSGEFDHDALYIQSDPVRRERLIELIRATAGIGSGHGHKDNRLRFHSQIVEYFEVYRVRFHLDNRTFGTQLNQIFKEVPRGKFSRAIKPLLSWLWDKDHQEAAQFYEDIGLSALDHRDNTSASRPSSAKAAFQIDALDDLFVLSEYPRANVTLNTTMDGTVALGHDVPWAISIKRFEYFSDENSLVLSTECGARRTIASTLPEHIADRLKSIETVRVTYWERGPQPGALSHDHYPLKVFS